MLSAAIELVERRVGMDELYRVRSDLHELLRTHPDALDADRQKVVSELGCLLRTVSFDGELDRTGIDLDYVQERLGQTVSAAMRLRYASVLWRSDRKHATLGRVALDAAFELIGVCRARDTQHSDGQWALQLCDHLQIAADLSGRFQSRTDELGDLLLELIEAYPEENSGCLVVRLKAAKLALSIKLGVPAYRLITEVFEPWGKRLVSAGRWSVAIHQVYPVGRGAAAKLGEDTRKWDALIGQAYEEMAQDRIQEPLVASNFMAQAAREFRRAGLSDSAERCQRSHSELKKKAEYSTSTESLDVTEFVTRARDFGRELAEKGPTTYFAYLAANIEAIPDWENVKVQAASLEGSLAFSIIPAEVRDIRGNTAQSFVGDEGLERYRLLTAMKFVADIQLRWTIEIVLAGVRARVLTSENVLGFVFASWLGTRFAPDGTPEEAGLLCWAESVAPGLVGVVSYFEYLADVREVCPDIVCFVDSLVLKFEGILRQYLQSSGELVTKLSRNRSGDAVQRELDINDILLSETIARDFGRSDLELMRYVLVEHAGMNLRNNIAHALLPARCYVFQHATWVFIMLMRTLRMRPSAEND